MRDGLPEFLMCCSVLVSALFTAQMNTKGIALLGVFILNAIIYLLLKRQEKEDKVNGITE